MLNGFTLCTSGEKWVLFFRFFLYILDFIDFLLHSKKPIYKVVKAFFCNLPKILRKTFRAFMNVFSIWTTKLCVNKSFFSNALIILGAKAKTELT